MCTRSISLKKGEFVEITKKTSMLQVFSSRGVYVAISNSQPKRDESFYYKNTEKFSFVEDGNTVFAYALENSARIVLQEI